MVWSFTFVNGFESIIQGPCVCHSHGRRIMAQISLALMSLCPAGCGLEDKGEYSGSWKWKGFRFSPIYLCQLYRKDTFGLKTPLCSAMIDCVILGVIFHKIELKSWILNYESLFAQCPFSGAGLEISLEESCCFLPPSELSPVSCGEKGCPEPL